MMKFSVLATLAVDVAALRAANGGRIMLGGDGGRPSAAEDTSTDSSPPGDGDARPLLSGLDGRMAHAFHMNEDLYQNMEPQAKAALEARMVQQAEEFVRDWLAVNTDKSTESPEAVAILELFSNPGNRDQKGDHMAALIAAQNAAAAVNDDDFDAVTDQLAAATVEVAEADQELLEVDSPPVGGPPTDPIVDHEEMVLGADPRSLLSGMFGRMAHAFHMNEELYQNMEPDAKAELDRRMVEQAEEFLTDLMSLNGFTRDSPEAVAALELFSNPGRRDEKQVHWDALTALREAAERLPQETSAEGTVDLDVDMAAAIQMIDEVLSEAVVEAQAAQVDTTIVVTTRPEDGAGCGATPVTSTSTSERTTEANAAVAAAVAIAVEAVLADVGPADATTEAAPTATENGTAEAGEATTASVATQAEAGDGAEASDGADATEVTATSSTAGIPAAPVPRPTLTVAPELLRSPVPPTPPNTNEDDDTNGPASGSNTV